MPTLPDNRTTSNTKAQHVADHNALHALYNEFDGEGGHADLTAHNDLGLATQAELDAVAAAKANTVHVHVDGDIPAGIARDAEVTAAVAAHVALGDPHTQYRLESVPIAAADVAGDVATQAELDAHVNDTTAAHAATAIAFTPTGTIAATTVQAAIAEVAAEAGGAGGGPLTIEDEGTPLATAASVLDFVGAGVTASGTTGDKTITIPGHPDLAAHDTMGLATQSELDAHVNDTTAAHAASATSFTPTGTIAATTVQAAIEEVAAEAGPGASLTVKDEGVALTAAATSLDFVGGGVVASGTTADKIITIAGHPDLAAHDTLGLATQTELDAVDAKLLTIGPILIKTANHTALLSDAGKTLEFNSATPVTFTLPTQLAVPFLRGQTIKIVQRGAGIVTVAHTTGTSVLRSEGSRYRTAGQWAVAEVYLSEDAPEEWVLFGNLQV